MEWFIALFRDHHTVSHAVLTFGLTITLGLALGQVQVMGISLGVGGVLFAGLLLGHLKMAIAPEILEFMREFGLILFVYAIGLQVGPGFFSSLRRHGLSLNLFAIAIVLIGTTIAIFITLFTNIEFTAVVGMLSGAVTNTPSLGAAQQALKDIPSVAAEQVELVGLGYAVAYPFGILGIIITMLLIKKIFRVDIKKEAEEFAKLDESVSLPLLGRSFEITNPNLEGKNLAELLDLLGQRVVITRVYCGGEEGQLLARPDLKLQLGHHIHAIGHAKQLDALKIVVGRESAFDLTALPSEIKVATLLVTQTEVVGKELVALDLADRFGVIVTRVMRSGVEFAPTKGLRIQFGDRLKVVGLDTAIGDVAQEVGNQAQALDRSHIMPIFVGIALGVIVGSIPFALPNIPAPVKLGLAGGPLLVAIMMGRFGKVGPILSYMPSSAKMLLREFGISIFLACVGIKSGERLLEIITSGDGLKWMAFAALITFVPLLIVGILARAWKKMNYLTICGLLSGSMTDPPALAYATQISKHDAPSISYATVYPLTMLLRVVLAQIIVILFLS
ncbi:MAG: putative transporter [Oligoflexia bacterium]|nr:putative transporter [Oligoflexia bacterium]